jgi:hypothetical protein
MKFTSSSYLALAIFPASPPFPLSAEADGPGHAPRAAARPHDGAAPMFPPAFLALLGTVFLVAGGDVGVSLGLILASLVWLALLLVVELHGTPTARPEVR